MKTYSAEEAYTHVEAWRASEQTRQSYSASHGINAHTFRGWCVRYRRQEATAKPTQRPPSVTTIPVQVASGLPSSAIEVQVGEVMLRVPGAVSSTWLAALIRALRSC